MAFVPEENAEPPHGFVPDEQPHGFVPDEEPGLLDQATDYLSSYAKEATPILPKIGNVLDAVGKGVAEGIQADVPIGPEESEVQRIQGLGPLTPSVQDVARGFGRVTDVAGRGISAAFQGGLEGFSQTLKESGVPLTEAEQLKRDVETLAIGTMGNAPGAIAGRPTGIKGLMKDFEGGVPFDAGILRKAWSDLTPAERARWGTEAKYRAAADAMAEQPRLGAGTTPSAPEGAAPTPPKEAAPSPFPNAAIDDLDWGGQAPHVPEPPPVYTPPMEGIARLPGETEAAYITRIQGMGSKKPPEIRTLTTADQEIAQIVREEAEQFKIANKREPTDKELSQMRERTKKDYSLAEQGKLETAPLGTFSPEDLYYAGVITKEELIAKKAEKPGTPGQPTRLPPEIEAAYKERLNEWLAKLPPAIPTTLEQLKEDFGGRASLTDAEKYQLAVDKQKGVPIQATPPEIVKKIEDALAAIQAEAGTPGQPSDKIVAGVEADAKKYADSIPELEKTAAAARAEKLRQNLEAIKERRKGLSNEQKFELALQDQRIEEDNKIRAGKKPKPQFTVIKGDLENRVPDPASVTPLPPHDYGLPPVVGLQEHSNTEISPYANFTTPITAMESSVAADDSTVQTAVIFKGDYEGLGNFKALDFGSPAQVEQKLLQYGEQVTGLLQVQKDQLPRDSYTALVEDLPTGQQDKHRVRGGTREGRLQLRAAIDLIKLDRRFSSQATYKGDYREQAFPHYMEFIKSGGIVEPSHGQGFALLNPGAFKDLLVQRPTKSAPRTTRTRATLIRANDLEAKGLYLFSAHPMTRGERGASADKPTVALDIARIQDSTAVSGLPWVTADVINYAYNKPVMEATIEDFQNAGVYWVKHEPTPLDWEDAQRMIWKAGAKMYGDHFKGWGRDFANLLARGMRIKVTPGSVEFVAIKREVERAAIPGIAFPEIGEGTVIGWAGPKTRQDKLVVKRKNPFSVDISPELYREIKGLTRLATQFFRSRGIKVALEVVPVTQDYMIRRGNGTATYGSLSPNRDTGIFRLNLNVDLLTRQIPPRLTYDKYGNVDLSKVNYHLGIDYPQLLSTFVHELGHLYLEYIWPELPFEIQDQITVAMERSALGNRAASYHEAVARSGSIAEYGAAAAVAPFPLTGNPGYANYFSDMHEFFARAVERHWLKELAWTGKSGRFLGKYSSALKELYKLAKNTDPNFWEASEAIKDAINYSATNPVIETTLGQSTNAAFNKSLRPSGDLALPGVEHPRTGATVDSREMLNKVFRGPPGPEFDGAAGGADWLAWQFRNIMTIVELARANKERIPATLRYIGSMRVWDAFKTRAAVQREQRIKEWQKLGETRADKTSKFLFYMGQQEYRTPIEKRERVSRFPTETERIAAARRFGIDQEMLNVYLGIEKDFAQFLNEIEAWEMQTARRRVKDPLLLQKELDDIAGKYGGMRKGPYFPATRFGTYVIWVRNPNSGALEYAEFFESDSERNAAGARLRNRYPNYQIKADKLDRQFEPFVGLPAALLEKIREGLNLDHNPELKDQFEALMFQLGPAQSFKKHWLRDEGVPGFSQDAIRVYASYMQSAYANLARQKYGFDAQHHVNDIHAYAATLRDPDRTRDLANFFQKHLDGVMNPAYDWNLPRAVMFQMFLAFNPKSALIQFAQFPLVVWPHLSKTYGTLTSTYQLLRAFGKAVANVDKIIKDASFSEDPIKQKARARAIYDNVISPGIAADLAAISSGSVSTYGRSKAAQFGSDWLRWGGWMMSMAEKLGRHVTWDANWELAKAGHNPQATADVIAAPDYREVYNEMRMDQELGLTDEQVGWALAAEDGVRRVWFEPGQWTRAPFMKGWKGFLFTFFTQLRHNAAYLLVGKARFRGFLMTLIFAGYMGLPTSEDLLNLFKQFASKFYGKDMNLDRMLRKQLQDMFSLDDRALDMIAHGISTESLGVSYLMNSMGLPFPRTDTSGSITMGRIIPGAANLNVRGEKVLNEIVGETALSAGQIPGAVLTYIFKTIYNPGVGWTDPKRFEPIVPNYIKYPARAARYAFEGRERDRRGNTVLEFNMSEPQDIMDVGMLGLGFPSGRLNQKYRSVGENIEAQEFYDAQAAQLTLGWRQAAKSGDQVAIQERVTAVNGYNDMVRKAGFPTLVIDLRKQKAVLETEKQKDLLMQQGLSPQQKYRGLSQETLELYGGEPRVIDKKKVR